MSLHPHSDFAVAYLPGTIRFLPLTARAMSFLREQIGLAPAFRKQTWVGDPDNVSEGGWLENQDEAFDFMDLIAQQSMTWLEEE